MKRAFFQTNKAEPIGYDLPTWDTIGKAYIGKASSTFDQQMDASLFNIHHIVEEAERDKALISQKYALQKKKIQVAEELRKMKKEAYLKEKLAK